MLEVSFQIAAFNAAETIEETLQSLLAQTYPHWEAVIVNDGSTDATSAIAERYAKLDHRFRVVNQRNKGLSAARNRGVSESRFDWIACLDADDMVLPDYLEKMTAALKASPDPDAVCCESARYFPDATTQRMKLEFDSGNFFAISSRMCPVRANAIIVKKQMIEQAGLFSTELSVCGDWDMWQRIARMGAKLTLVREPLALFRIRPGSLSNQGEKLFEEALQIIDRGHREDARVASPDPRYRHGAAPGPLADEKLAYLCWAAGILIGSGRSAARLFTHIQDIEAGRISEERAANLLFTSVLLPAAAKPQDWPDLAERFLPHLQEFLEQLGCKLNDPDLAHTALMMIGWRIGEIARNGMRVTFIIPAYNADKFLAQTLDSVIAQTLGEWEAVIVDDGSTDATAEIAQRYADQDPRFRLIRQPNGGVSRARNTAIRAARTYWVAALDSDDLIEPTYLEKMTAMLRVDPTADAVYCEFARLAPDGTKIPKTYWFDQDDIFEVATRTCPIAAHGTIIRRDLLLEVGLFDETLKTCEDWDVWLRVARTGAKFVAFKEPLALYRMRPGSASNQGLQMLRDSMRVLKRAHQRDERVRHTIARYEYGAHPREIHEKKLEMVCWAAALVIGTGDDPAKVFEGLSGLHFPEFPPESAASCLYEGVTLPSALKPSDWPALLAEKSELIDAFYKELETRSGAKNLAVRSRRILQEMILRDIRPSAPMQIGNLYSQAIDITQPFAEIDLPAGVDRVTLGIAAGDRQVGVVSIPIYQSRLTEPIVADAIASQLHDEVLSAYFAHALYPKMRIAHSGEDVHIERAGLKMRLPQQFASVETSAPKFAAMAQPYLCRLLLLQEAWGFPDWSMDRFYSLKQAAVSSNWKFAADVVFVDIFDDIPTIVRMSSDLKIIGTAAGATLGVIPIHGGTALITPQELRSWFCILFNKEIAAVIARECILWRDFETVPSIRETGKEILRIRAANGRQRSSATALAPQTASIVDETTRKTGADCVFLRSDPLVQEFAASRRFVLPGDLASEAKTLFGKPESGCETAQREPALLLYEPAAPARELLAGTVGESDFAPGHGLLLRLPSPLVRVAQGLRRIAGKSGGEQDGDGWAPRSHEHLTVLMYHRIAASGAYETRRWRTAPEDFRAQLQFLKTHGYRSVTLEEWYRYRTVRKPMPVRPVLLTFDDGFVDFYENAWPILKEFGFGANVYLVSERIGKTNSWDIERGEELPLMDWKMIRKLRDEGVEFGCHTATHAQLTMLSSHEAASEMARSRATLRLELGMDISSIAYPFGGYDRYVPEIAASCGYRFALTCEERVAAYTDHLLMIPRIEVSGYDTLSRFEEKVLIAE